MKKFILLQMCASNEADCKHNTYKDEYLWNLQAVETY